MAAVDETWLGYRFSNTLASKAGIFFCLSTKIAVFADIVESGTCCLDRGTALATGVKNDSIDGCGAREDLRYASVSRHLTRQGVMMKPAG